MPYRQTSLEQQPRAVGVGENASVELDGDVPMGAQDVHSVVGVAHLCVHGLVLDEPAVGGCEVQLHEAGQGTRDRVAVLLELGQGGARQAGCVDLVPREPQFCSESGSVDHPGLVGVQQGSASEQGTYAPRVGLGVGRAARKFAGGQHPTAVGGEGAWADSQ